MQKVTLPNGLTIIFKRKKGKAIVIEAMVKVGSNDEEPSRRGISHFLEHMVFEGTAKRPSNMAISNEIEKIGGEFNAYTTNERTCYHIKVLQRHFPIAVEILADILQNPLFQPKDIRREKRVVLKEIDMINDEPRFYQWILFQQALFRKFPARYPTYGTRKTVRSLAREQVIRFFRQYYRPNNIVLAITGDVKNWKAEVQRKFQFLKAAVPHKRLPAEPVMKKSMRRKEKRSIANTYVVLGFRTVPRTNADAYALEVINGILGRGQSGRMFSEIRVKRGLAYDVGTQHVAEVNFGYFAVYATIDRKKLSTVQSVILEELKKLENISEEDLKESQDFIEGNYLLGLEDPQKLADQLLFWEHAKNAELLGTFIGKIKRVTVADVQRAAKKYFKNYALAVVEGR